MNDAPTFIKRYPYDGISKLKAFCRLNETLAYEHFAGRDEEIENYCNTNNLGDFARIFNPKRIFRFNNQINQVHNNVSEDVRKAQIASGIGLELPFKGKDLRDLKILDSKIFSKLAATLAWLHSEKYIHGDVKPYNALYEETDQSVYLIDFESMHKYSKEKEIYKYLIEENDIELNTFAVGSIQYCSPETIELYLRSDPNKDYISYINIWILNYNSIIDYINTGGNPLHVSNESFNLSTYSINPAMDVFALAMSMVQIAKPKKYQFTINQKKFLGRCLAFEPTQRPTMLEVARFLHEDWE